MYTIRYAAPLFCESHMHKDIMEELAKRNIVLLSHSRDRKYQNRYSDYFISQGQHWPNIKVKQLYTELQYNIHQILDLEATNALEKIRIKFTNMRHDNISVEEFMTGVVSHIDGNTRKFVTAKEAARGRERATGVTVYDALQSNIGRIPVSPEQHLQAKETIQWAGETYALSVEGFKAGVANALAGGWIHRGNANLVAYAYLDFLYNNGKAKNLLKVSYNPVLVTVTPLPELGHFQDEHENTIVMKTDESFKDAKYVILRGVIKEIREGGTYGIMEGMIVGKKFTS